MKGHLTFLFLVVTLCGAASTQIQRQLLPGRYFTPETLSDKLKRSATEESAQSYLIGAYDLTQDSGQSCGVRGTTNAPELEQIFSQYLQAHSDLMHADRTAAGVARQAFSEYWPCPKQQLLPGRYFTPDTLSNRMKSSATERSAQLYLIGAYDLTQDSGQSCAVRGTTNPSELEQIFSQYLQAHSELIHADRTAAGVAGQAFSEYWPCPKQRSSQSSRTLEPDTQIGRPTASSLSESANIKFQVIGWFSLRDYGTLIYRENVAMPEPYRDNAGHWSLTCERALSQGSYEGTYDQHKNKIRVQALDLKGKLKTTKCEVFSHDWRAPSR
jgi:hypothetical protein